VGWESGTTCEVNQTMSETHQEISVWCVMIGVGFPGLAQANRVTMVGRALQESGCGFKVCHIGANPLMKASCHGVHEGIPYRYYPENVSYSPSRLKRQVGYLKGMVQLLKEIAAACKSGEQVVVYAWCGSANPAVVLFRWGLRKVGAKIISECNEWWPGKLKRIVRFISVFQSDGMLVISNEIVKRLRKAPVFLVRPILTVPILTDTDHHPVGAGPISGSRPYLLWCGDASGNRKDIVFMLEIMERLQRSCQELRLFIAGKITDEFRLELAAECKRRALAEDCVKVTGYLSDEQLQEHIGQAFAHLLPLWADEERSVCRFPTKLGGYLASGRPVVTSPVGAVGEFLVDGKSAMLCPSGDSKSYEEAICSLFNDPAKAQSIGTAGRKTAEEVFDYRVYSKALREFFEKRCCNAGEK